jgi:hypothetical protein
MITIGTIRLRRDDFFATKGTSMLLRRDRSPRPEIEERIDVVIERIGRLDDFEYVMNEDVRQQRSHEEERRGARVFDLDDAGFLGAAEVARDDLQATLRRTVFGARIKRHDQRRVRLLVHGDDEVRHDHRSRERHPLLGHAAKHDPRIGRGVDGLQVDNALRQRHIGVHRRFEKGLLGVEVPQDRRGGDTELPGDIR